MGADDTSELSPKGKSRRDFFKTAGTAAAGVAAGVIADKYGGKLKDIIPHVPEKTNTDKVYDNIHKAENEIDLRNLELFDDLLKLAAPLRAYTSAFRDPEFYDYMKSLSRWEGTSKATYESRFKQEPVDDRGSIPYFLMSPDGNNPVAGVAERHKFDSEGNFIPNGLELTIMRLTDDGKIDMSYVYDLYGEQQTAQLFKNSAKDIPNNLLSIVSKFMDNKQFADSKGWKLAVDPNTQEYPEQHGYYEKTLNTDGGDITITIDTNQRFQLKF